MSAALALEVEAPDQAALWDVTDEKGRPWTVYQYRQMLCWLELPGGLKAFLRYQCDRATLGTGGDIRPGTRRMIEDTGYKKDWVEKWRAEAIRRNLLVEDHRGDSTGRTSVARLVVPWHVALYWRNYRDDYEVRVAGGRPQAVDKSKRKPAVRDERGWFAPVNSAADAGKNPAPPEHDLPPKDSGDLSVRTVPTQGAGQAVEETRSDQSSLSHCGVRPDSVGGGDGGGVEPGAVDDSRRRGPARRRLPAGGLRRAAVRGAPDRGPRPGVPRRPVRRVWARNVGPGRPDVRRRRGPVPPADRPPEGTPEGPC